MNIVNLAQYKLCFRHKQIKCVQNTSKLGEPDPLSRSDREVTLRHVWCDSTVRSGDCDACPLISCYSDLLLDNDRSQPRLWPQQKCKSAIIITVNVNNACDVRVRASSSFKMDHEVANLQNEIDSLQNSVDDVRRKCEQEVAMLQSRIVDKKRQINNKIPAVTLIPELLVEVFKYCQQGLPGWRATFLYRGMYKWLRVTHVCHRWREVALQYANLWNDVYATDINLELVKLFLRRSKGAALHLYYLGERQPYGDEPVLRELFKELHRIQTLDIRRFSQPALRSIVEETLASSTSAPMLRSMVVADAHTSMPSNISLCDCFNALDSPRLSSLEIEASLFSITQTIFNPSLQKLQLKSSTRDVTSLQDLSQVLAKLPLLRVLELSCMMSLPPESETNRSLHSVQLIHLRELRIKDRFRPAVDLLRNLAFPASTKIFLDLTHATSSDNARYLALADAVAPVFARDEGTTESTTALHLSQDYGGLILQAWRCKPETQPCDWNVSSTGLLPHVSICVNPRAALLVETFVSRIHTQDVRRLGLVGMSNVTTHDLWLSRRHFPNVQALSVESVDCLPAMLEHKTPSANMINPLPTPSPEERTLTFFPSLSLLRLHRVVLREMLDIADGSNDFINRCIDACEYRRNVANSPIHSVQISDCMNVVDEDVNELESVVSDVDWDGEQNLEESDDDRYGWDDGEDFIPLDVFDFPPGDVPVWF